MNANNISRIDSEQNLLNRKITESNPAVLDLISIRGKRIYFPKKGIISQSAEARDKDINATIGIALAEDKSTMSLPCLSKLADIPQKAFSYASSCGCAELRELWKAMILKKNHSLCGKSFSLPIVTSGLTHGLSICGYLFCDPGSRIIIPHPFWKNYELIFSHAYQTTFDTFSFFNDSDGFNIAMLREKLLSGKPGKRIVCLNFPNNPTGYTPSESEAKAIAEVFLQAATKGCKIVVLIDDAYFGLVFKRGIYTESIFSKLCNLHPNLLAVKLDGATKEDYAWGMRIGFITYGIADSKPNLLNALESKTAAAVRGTISSASNIAQALLIKAYSSDTYEKEKRTQFAVLQKRYKKVNKILAAHPEYKQEFIPLPFNSGYFMCVKLLHADSEKVRQKLLTDYSIGVIATGNLIRLAFSSTPTDQLDRLFDGLYKAAISLKHNKNTSTNHLN